eukprot:14713741-Alexandrium_andersonii.AAC.1
MCYYLSPVGGGPSAKQIDPLEGARKGLQHYKRVCMQLGPSDGTPNKHAHMFGHRHPRMQLPHAAL